MDPSEPMLPCGQREEYPKTPAQKNGIENRFFVTPHVTSSVPIEDVASLAELAKAYMGSRPSKVSSSMLGVQNPVLREDPTLLKRENFPLKSPIMSIVPKATRHAAVHENGFVTPGSHGRSAIYRMARTPYARIFLASTLKGGGLAVQGEPSSSTRSALDHDILSGPNKGTLKRRSSALDNDVGSFGRILHIRHKSNLGRSAIYSMARTPYARIYPASTLKGGGLAVEGEPSSSTRSALDHDMLSGPNKGVQVLASYKSCLFNIYFRYVTRFCVLLFSFLYTLKHRSSILDNDIGSFGRIHQIRHKSNLLYSKGSSLPLSGSSLAVARSGVGIYAAQQPSSSMQKPILLDEVKRSHTKLSEENVDNTIPSMSYSPLPSKSSEMASKILHQLDKWVSPKEKSSELRLPIVNDNSPTKLSPSMLQGQALRSMEMVDSSKLLDNV